MTDSPPDGDVPAERPLGRNYAKLWTASTVSNLGDGIDSAALPLLAEALTRDPLLFAGVAVANRLPWLLFSLHAGAIADRMDRRTVMVVSNVARFILMAGLGVAILTGNASIWLLYMIALGLGTFETLFDNAAQTILPSLVRRGQLEKANGRLLAGEIVTNQFSGPPLGAFLFGISAALPILVDAGTFAVSAGLLVWLGGTYRGGQRAVAAADELADDVVAATSTMLAEIREGLAWLWHHRLLRTLAILLALANLTNMMGAAIFGLYAIGEESILQLEPLAFGFLLTAAAAGAFIATLLVQRIVDRVGRGPTLWVSLAGTVVIPLAIGLTSSPWVVAGAMALSGVTAVTWNVVTVSLRQTIIPDELLGRVNSVYRFMGWGAMPVGSILGGILGSLWGLRAPFLIAALIMAIAFIPGVRRLSSADIERARRDASTPSG
jgi:MFS family permease